MKILLDTNVIIDAVASREPWNTVAEKIILLASQEKLEAIICASAVTDIYYICNKVFHDDVKAREVIKSLFSIFSITDVKKKDLKDALNLDMADYEDALICTCAKRTNSQFIITRNTKDFANSPVPIINPQDFISKFFK